MPGEYPSPLGILASRDLADLYTRVRESLALVYRKGSNGAGIVWSSDGLIVTNGHVVAPSGEAQVVLANGHRHVGIVVARHPTRDLALIKIATEGLTAIDAGDSSSLKTGEFVAAIGHPLGYRDAITAGIVVSSRPRPHEESDDSLDLIRTDARFAPGNSGGPLVDSRGRVVGVCTRVAGRLGMAVPSNAVIEFIERGTGSRPHSPIGVTGVPVVLSRPDYESGLLLTEVVDDSLAERAGLFTGDIIVALGTRRVSGRDSWLEAIRDTELEGFSATIIRGGTVEQVRFPNGSTQVLPTSRTGAGAASTFDTKGI